MRTVLLALYLGALSILAVAGHLMVASAEDASIGGGLLLLPVLAAAVPWNVGVVSAFEDRGELLPVSLLWLGAALNGLAVWWWAGRSARRAVGR
jgi:hypothetical protein